MLYFIFKRIKKIVSNIKFDDYEKVFFESNLNKIKYDSKNSLQYVYFQIPDDYYVLCNTFEFIQGNRLYYYKLIGVWPHSVNTLTSEESIVVQVYRFVVLKIEFFLKRLKWQKLYTSTGIKSFEKNNSLFFLFNFSLIFKSIKDFKNIKTKRDLLNYKIENICVGDLIYDTYLRYRCQPTVNTDSWYLLYLIILANDSYFHFKKKFSNECPLYYFSSYSSYIQHGIPVRLAIFFGAEVYTQMNHVQYAKKLTKDDWYHTVAYENYKDIFSKFPDQANLKEKARLELEKRFKGEKDLATSYMKKSSFHFDYEEIDIFKDRVIDGVLFLHDFFDSPHCYKNMIFEDFWEWTIFSLELIRKFKLPIAIKGHPNQREESLVVLKKIKNLYNDLVWIEPSISNNLIFKSGIKFGVSVHGTVLYELAYFNLLAISAGENPTSSYEFTLKAKTEEEYLNFLLNYQNYLNFNCSKDEIFSFYYMHTMYEQDDFFSPSRHLELKNLDFSRSYSLLEYMRLKKSNF